MSTPEDERPASTQRYRTGPEWTSATVPDALRHRHALKAGVWGELVVLAGCAWLRFEPPDARELELPAGSRATIPPERPHTLALTADAVVRIDFYR